MAISIIGGLRDSLDHDTGAEVAVNLERLYEYMSSRLLEANIGNDVSVLEEVQGLLMEIKSAWDAIGELPPLNSHLNGVNGELRHKPAI